MQNIEQLNINNTLTTDPKKITNEIYEFWSDMYSERPMVPANEARFWDHCPNHLITKLSQEKHDDKLEEPYTLDELTTAINQMQDNKSPEFDGLTVEFYINHSGSVKVLKCC